jgi:hypothetical protein
MALPSFLPEGKTPYAPCCQAVMRNTKGKKTGSFRDIPSFSNVIENFTTECLIFKEFSFSLYMQCFLEKCFQAGGFVFPFSASE